MSDPELRLTPTHAADQFQGRVLGIATDHFLWVVAALLASLAIFLGLFYGRRMAFLDAMGWAALPLLIVVTYLRLCHQGKPPGHTRDLIESLFTGGHAVPPPPSHDHAPLA